MSRLRIRGGATEGALPPDPPGGGGTYTFPTTAFTFPLLPDDGGTVANDGLINMLDYGCMGNGSTDDGPAIIDAIFANRELSGHPWSKKTLFFPGTPASPKTYFIGASTTLAAGSRGMLSTYYANEWHGGFRIQGQSEAGTIIRIADSHPSYQNAADPRFVIYQSNYTGFEAGDQTPHQNSDGTGLEAYYNMIRDITIDLGQSNPGAAGINAMMHNVGWIRRVTVQDAVGAGRSTNTAHYAYAGICEERQGAGPNHWSRITVKGTQYPIRVGQVMCGQSIEHLRIVNPGTCGIVNDSNGLFIRGLKAESMRVPVAEIRTGGSTIHTGESAAMRALDWVHTSSSRFDDTYGYMLIVDAVITGTASTSALSAIRNRTAGGKMFLRGITTTGYARAAEENGGAAVAGGANLTEYATPPVHQLWGQTPSTLNILIKNTPEKPWATLSDWTPITAATPGFPNGVQISHAGGTQFTNSWASLQSAFDNCPTETLYIPSTRNGRLRFSGSTTLTIGTGLGNVRHFVGNGMYWLANAGDTLTVRFAHPTRPVGKETVFWEDCYLQQFADVPTANMEIATPRDVVIMDTTFGQLTNTAAATGTVYLEDVIGGTVDFDFPQNIFSRQHDRNGGKLVDAYSGGDFWCLYVKSEPKTSSAVAMLPSTWQGRIEVLGAFSAPVFPTGSAPATHPVWEVTNPGTTLNAELSVAGFASSIGGTGGTYLMYGTETQNGVNRDLLPGGATYGSVVVPALDPRGTKHHVTLYRSKM